MRAVDTALEELLTREREILNGLSRDEKTQLAQLLSLLAADLDEGKNN